MDILNRNVVFVVAKKEDEAIPLISKFLKKQPGNYGGTFCYASQGMFDDVGFSSLGGVTHFIVLQSEVSDSGKEAYDFIRGVSSVTKSFCLFCKKDFSYEELDEYLSHTEKTVTKAQIAEKARFALFSKGFTATPESLFTAVKTGKESLLSLFFMTGISPDCINSEGLPLLIWLVRNKFYKLLPIVIKAGADVNIVSPDRGYSALMECAMDRQNEAVRQLLEAGANPDIVGKDGQSALILAVCNNDKDITSLLLQYKANPALPDKMGMTAEGYAKLFNKTEILMQFA